MIGIILTEKDFEYELQALAGNFFPGQECRVFCEGEELPELALAVRMELKREGVRASFETGTTRICFEEKADEDRDWHKHPDKSRHPYRSHYKNLVKQTLFSLLMAIPKSRLPEGVGRIVPPWGTMTGVRPAKIPMNALLQGRDREDVKEELEKVYLCEDDRAELCLRVAEREAAVLMGKDFSDEYSLYIGIPFCPTTCLYCSFPSYPCGTFGHLSDDYMDALTTELRALAQECAGHAMTSVYLGGGTPTALSADQLERLLVCVEEHFPVLQCREWTVEAGRPDSITQEKLRVLARHGISRISINPQTMQEETLRHIGRDHSVQDVKKAFCLARELGFDNINMDLIAGLPGEGLNHFDDTLCQIKGLGPDSITVHSLVIKRASKLREMLCQADDCEGQERERQIRMDAMLKRAIAFADEQGYEPYYMYRQKNSGGYSGLSGQENIGFARSGKECLYNVLMMEELQTIAAAGAGASTKFYHASEKIVSRRENVKSITDYISRIDEMIERKRGRFWEMR